MFYGKMKINYIFINKINEKMEKYNSSNIKIKFTPEDNSENRN